MLPFATSFASIDVALVVPSLLGLLFISAIAKSVKAKYLAAFALGLCLWFFSDTIGDSAYLDVNQGFTGGAVQVALVALFVIGLLLLFSLDRRVFDATEAVTGTDFTIPLLVAVAVGVHGWGEGAAFSATAAATPATNLVDAFGGVSAAFAFVLHKALEPMMVGTASWVYAKDHAKTASGLIKDIIVLALAFTLPGILGGATDYFLSYDTSYFFAFGLGTSVYAAVRLAKRRD